jgi:hypothetical protein
LSACLSARLSICLSASLSLFLFICLSVYLSTHLCIYLCFKFFFCFSLCACDTRRLFNFHTFLNLLSYLRLCFTISLICFPFTPLFQCISSLFICLSISLIFPSLCNIIFYFSKMSSLLCVFLFLFTVDLYSLSTPSL